MGWTQNLSGKTLKQTIADYTKEGPGRKLLKKCFRGAPTHSGVLWTVWEIECNDGVTRRVIGCDIMEYWRHKGSAGWAVKSIDETMGPYYNTCPLSYLDLASGPNSYANESYSKEWRERVRSYHAHRKARRHTGS